MPDGATTTVPFALERSLAVETQREFTEEGARVAKIESGLLSIERDSVARTRYRIKNGGDQMARIMVKHRRNVQARLFNPPKGTEDNVGSGSALVPTDAAPHAMTDLTVDERQSTERNIDWLSQQADDAIRLYMADKRADAAAVATLRSAWDVRLTLVRAVEERSKLGASKTSSRRRPKRPAATSRRSKRTAPRPTCVRRLTERLAKNALRLEEITKRLVELDMRVNEQRVRFSDMVRSLKVLTPPKSAT